MTATLEEIHRDPEIIDRAISRREQLEIISNGVITGVFTPTERAPEPNGYEGYKRLSPDELAELAAQLASAPDDKAAEALKEKLLQGFYGETRA